MAKAKKVVKKAAVKKAKVAKKVKK